MRVRAMKLGLLAAATLLVVAMPAKAATVPISANNAIAVALEPGNDYQGANFLKGGGEDVFKFSLPAGPLGSISATVSFSGKGVFEIAWFKNADPVPLAGFTLASQVSPLVLTLLDTASIYYLHVRNIASEGVYGLSVTTTPLPPALILFGTALAGLTWLGRRRRPARAGIQA